MSSGRSSALLSATLEYPAHLFEPEDLLLFIQSTKFSERWDRLHLMDEDLQALELIIMADPKGNPVIPGTGGLRKLRFGRSGQGSRGSLRVCYVYFEEVRVVHLLVIYAKNEKDDLSEDEKSAYKQLIGEIKKRLSHGLFR